jgi:hypothetical protein
MKRKAESKVVVLCENASSQFGLAGTLNDFGYYCICLCSTVAEVVTLLAAGKHYEYLIYDGFDLATDNKSLQEIARYAAVASVIVISDVNSQERQGAFQWAKQKKIPLLGVLQAPVRPSELGVLIGRVTPVWGVGLREYDLEDSI